MAFKDAHWWEHHAKQWEDMYHGKRNKCDELEILLIEARRLAEDWRTRCMGDHARFMDEYKMPWEEKENDK